MSYEPRILALDLATRSGWALGYPRDPVPYSGSCRFVASEGRALGATFSACRNWLRDMLDVETDIGLIVFEAPMVPQHMDGKTSAHVIRILIGLCAVAEEIAYARKLDVREATVSDVRRHFIGTARIKRPEAKSATIAACHRLGWKPADDNAADALALWHYQASLLVPELAVQTSPLFRRRIA